MEIVLILILLWLAGAFRRKKTQRHFVVPSYEAKGLITLQSLSPREFEAHCASWLENQGYRCELTPAVGDGNIDIVVKTKEGTPIGIGECKRWKAPVGAKTVKILYATMLQHGYTQGWFFSVSGFSEGARNYVQRIPSDNFVYLIDGRVMQE